MSEATTETNRRPLAGSPVLAKWLALAVLAVLAGLYVNYLTAIYDGPAPLYDASGSLIGRDFVSFWTASDLVLDGKVADLADPETFKRHYETRVGPLSLKPEDDGGFPWFYPPTGLLPVLPLALLPYIWSYGLWVAATFALYLLASVPRDRLWPDAAVLLLAPTTLCNLLPGQNGFLSAALLIGGLRLLERRPWVAGVLLGLLSFKPHLGLLVPLALAAGGHRRAFGAAAATVAAMVAASVALFGIESWSAFLGTSLGLQDKLLNELGGSSLGLAVAPIMSARVAGFEEPARYGLYAVLAGLAAWGVFVTFRNPEAEAELRAPVLLAGVLLASPYGHVYDMAMVSVAVLWCYRHAMRDGFLPGEIVLLGLVWLLPFLALVLNTRGLPPGPPVLAAFFLLVLAKANGWLPRGEGRRPGGSVAVPG